jgi:hypothetical protein
MTEKLVNGNNLQIALGGRRNVPLE